MLTVRRGSSLRQGLSLLPGWGQEGRESTGRGERGASIPYGDLLPGRSREGIPGEGWPGQALKDSKAQGVLGSGKGLTRACSWDSGWEVLGWVWGEASQPDCGHSGCGPANSGA